jgi:hypothetical protein
MFSSGTHEQDFVAAVFAGAVLASAPAISPADEVAAEGAACSALHEGVGTQAVMDVSIG